MFHKSELDQFAYDDDDDVADDEECDNNSNCCSYLIATSQSDCQISKE